MAARETALGATLGAPIGVLTGEANGAWATAAGASGRITATPRTNITSLLRMG
ncbi:unannotated protein [freshwater metagenome]|uniref:Unannotated protein n=1 Tax=freshwater metagenome TaxID=449393 RepID=A0A6J6QP00_9ZZZZ